MAERVQVRDLRAAPDVRPAARPIDTFITPAVAQPADSNGLLDLAGALEQVRPSIARWARDESVTEGKRWTAEEIAAGQKAYAENRKAFKEAVDNGAIPAGASPHYQRGYKQAELRNLGFTYDQRLREEYATSGVANADDPEALSNFMAEFRANFLNENVGEGHDDIDISEALLPQIERSQSVLAQRHVEQRIKQVEQGYARETEQEVFTALDNMAEQPEGFDAMVAGPAIQTRLDDAIANGMNKTQANRLIVDSITNKAIDAGDLDILDTLDEINAGPGGKLGSTRYARDKRERAEDAITQDRMQQERYAHWQNERYKTDLARQYTSDAFEKIIENPGANINAELQALRKVDPSAAASLLSFRSAKLSSDTRVIENPAIVQGLYAQLDDPEANHGAVIAQYAASRLISAGTAKSAHSYARQTRTYDKPLQDRVFKEARSDLESIIKGNDFDENSVTRFRALRAGQELRRRYVAWLETNDSPSELEKSEFVTEQTEKIARSQRWSGRDVAEEIDRSVPQQAQPQQQQQALPNSPANRPAPPEAAVEYLRNNPGSWEQFEEKFGAGASIPYLKALEWPPVE